MSLQINSLVAIISLALPSLRELIIIVYRQGNVDEYIRPIGLTSGYEFSAFASIILAIISYNKQNYIFFLIGLFAASITGRTGLLFSAIYLIYLLIYNLLSAINISIIQEKIKLKKLKLTKFFTFTFYISNFFSPSL